MLAQYRLPVSFCLLSTDLPILSALETSATLYQKDVDQYHLLINLEATTEQPKQLLWLELSSYRVIMTVQSAQQFNYRHFWEPGVYGSSRYWLNDPNLSPGGTVRLRNYTRSLELKTANLPQFLRLEYELWSPPVKLGQYVIHLDFDS